MMLEPARYNRAYREILERLEALPGVTAAGFGDAPLEGRNGPGATIYVEGRSDAVAESPPTRRFMLVSPGQLEALGTRLIAGRGLTWADVDETHNVVLVSENLAREVWGEPRAAIGKRIRTPRDAPGVWHEIVGVTQDIRDELYQRAPPIVYRPPKMDSDLRAITYAIRSDRAGTESLVNEVRQAVWATHPDLAVFQVRTMHDIYSDALATTSFVLVLLAIAGAMALVLGVVGIYGVIAYVVSQRSREIGIRLALGAEAQAVKRMFLLHGLGVATIGIGVGLAGAAAFSRWMASLLFEVRPLDPATYLAVVGVLLVAVSFTAYLPARRAARLDPAETLRAE